MNSRYTIVMLTAVLAAATGAAVASAVQTTRVLEATGLHIRGTDGKMYARLESWESRIQEADGDDQPVTTSRGAHLVFYDEEEHARLTLGTSGRGASISFFDTTGVEQVRLHLTNLGGPNLTLSDDTGRTLFEAGSR